MSKTIKAKFSHGLIEPLEKIDFPEGKLMTLTIDEVPETEKVGNISEALDSTFGSWAGLVDCEELKRNIYSDRQISTRPEVKL